MLSLTSEIMEKDIHSVNIIKGGTVYLLKGHGDDLIVKAESGIIASKTQHFNLSKKAMGVVDKDVKTSKKLSDNELSALLGYVKRQKTLVEMNVKGRLPGAAKDLDEALKTLQDPLMKNVWYKMPKLNMSNMQDALEHHFGNTEDGFKDGEAVDQSSALMRSFLKTLRGSGGLESLGKVIAMDMFSGNSDRFIPKASRTISIAGWSYTFKTLQNPGNLMFISKGNGRTISGMDFADPTSMLSLADQSLNAQEQTYDQNWLGRTIANSGQRKDFVKDIVSDLEKLLALAPKKSIRDKLPGGPLGLGAERRLDSGMVSGAKALVKVYREKVKAGKTYPSSYSDRIQIYERVR